MTSEKHLESSFRELVDLAMATDPIEEHIFLEM